MVSARTGERVPPRVPPDARLQPGLCSPSVRCSPESRGPAVVSPSVRDSRDGAGEAAPRKGRDAPVSPQAEWARTGEARAALSPGRGWSRRICRVLGTSLSTRGPSGFSSSHPD